VASNRHLGRIVALQALYEYDFRKRSGDPDVDIEEIISRNVERYKDTIDDLTFVEGLIRGTAAKLEELDKLLQPLAPEWPLEQIARIDHAILRLSLHELFYMPEAKIPPKVTINEAVELAKSFGADKSSKFINGVLGSAWRQAHPDEEDSRIEKLENNKEDADASTSNSEEKAEEV
jgi:N utilization substance protein B